MLARGNLPKCLDAMARELAKQEHLFLSIIHNPKGRYYTLITETELLACGDVTDEGHNRLVLRLNWRELRQIHLLFSAQGSLFERPHAN